MAGGRGTVTVTRGGIVTQDPRSRRVRSPESPRGCHPWDTHPASSPWGGRGCEHRHPWGHTGVGGGCPLSEWGVAPPPPSGVPLWVPPAPSPGAGMGRGRWEGDTRGRKAPGRRGEGGRGRVPGGGNQPLTGCFPGPGAGAGAAAGTGSAELLPADRLQHVRGSGGGRGGRGRRGGHGGRSRTVSPPSLEGRGHSCPPPPRPTRTPVSLGFFGGGACLGPLCPEGGADPKIRAGGSWFPTHTAPRGSGSVAFCHRVV